jgi:lactate dehydrogenase-like 2-hydroxyacid dehydrogenase
MDLIAHWIGATASLHWRESRRVELTFHQVSRPDELRTILAPLTAENLQTQTQTQTKDNEVKQ